MRLYSQQASPGSSPARTSNPHASISRARLLASAASVEELVREFVPRGLVADPDFSGLERVNVKFHPARRSARRREADVIWRLPSRKGSDIHVYLLIEFQSDIDEWMAIRTQVYEVLLWQQVIDEYKLRASTRLPPLLSLVLYNGQRRWKAATTGRELIALSPDSTLWPWQASGQTAQELVRDEKHAYD